MHTTRWVVVVAAVCSVVAVVAVAYAAGAAKAAPVLRAQRFELVDEDGKAWASLGFEGRQVGLRLLDAEGEVRASLLLRGEQGQPELSLRDEKNGNVEVNLAVPETGPRVGVRGADGATQAYLDVRNGSQPGVTLLGKDGKTGVVIATGAAGSVVGMRDQGGDPLVGLGTSPDGSSWLGLGAKGSKAGVNMAAGPDGSVSVKLMDSSGRVRSGTALASDGWPAFGLGGTNTQHRIVLGLQTDGSHLLMQDADGNLRAELSGGADTGLTLYGADKAMRALFAVSAKDGDSPVLRLFDSAGRTVWSAR